MSGKKKDLPPINLGAAPFLNMRPLIYPLEKGVVEHRFSITYLEPFLLSEKLSEGVLDVAPVPSIEFLKNEDRCIVPGVSISSFGKVDSVILRSRKKITEIKSVSVDSRSRSSTALLRIILELFFGLGPEYVKREPGNGFMEEVDAGMLIGDAGLAARHLPDEEPLFTYDLGELWTNETSLPFVYAVMALRKGDADTAEGCRCLVPAKEEGAKLVAEIADAESRRLGLSRRQCATYLTERIRYGLGGPETEGLARYRDLLFELGELEKKNEINFCEHLSPDEMHKEKKWKSGS